MKALLFSIFIFLGMHVWGQKFSTSLDVQVPIPQGDFKTMQPKSGVGLRGNVLYKPGIGIPLKFGLELGYIHMPKNENNFLAGDAGIEDQFRMIQNGGIFSVMMLARFQPSIINKVKPFLDLTAGWNHINATVEAQRLTNVLPGEIMTPRESKSDWILSYGLTGGLDIPMDKSDKWGMELKLSYFVGNNIRFLSQPFLHNRKEISYVPDNVKTDMLIPQLGIRYSF